MKFLLSMSGINGYFNGKYVTRDANYIILLLAVVTIGFISGLYITCFASFWCRAEDSTRVLTPHVLAAYASTEVIHSLIVIEGVLERNIIQIVLSSVFNLVTFAFLLGNMAVYLEDATEYIYIGFGSANLLFNLYILYWVYTLRKEFGWFYYKSYGAEWESNNICTIRKTQSVLIRLLVQDVISFWMFRNVVFADRPVQYPSTALYYGLVLLYLIEAGMECYLLRAMHICLTALLLAYVVWQIVWSAGMPESWAGKKPSSPQISLTFLSDSCVRAVILLLYLGVLVADLNSFQKGFRGYYKIRQRQRMEIKE